jgi:mono/diheme cytochrome c family protein
MSPGNSKLAVIFALGMTLCLLSVTLSSAGTSAAKISKLTTESDVSDLYESRCAKCHGKDGRAKTFAGKLKGARNFTDPKWQSDTTDEHIVNSITNGKKGMPAFGAKLSEAEIASLAGYIRSFNGPSKQK